jgi:hypothetical protein
MFMRQGKSLSVTWSMHGEEQRVALKATATLIQTCWSPAAVDR